MQSLEEKASQLIATVGHKKAFQQIISEHDLQIANPATSGWKLVKKRTQIIDYFLKDWFKDIFKAHEDENNFAFIAHGGQGRMEMTPNSDADIMLFIDSPLLDQSELANKYSEHGQRIHREFGLNCVPIVKNKQDMHSLDNKSLNTLLDARLLGANRAILDQFMQEIISSYDYTDLLVHNVNFWNDTRNKNHTSFGDISRFDIKYGRGGLRNFQAGVWSQAIEQYRSSLEIYSLIPKHVLKSVEFILKLRYKLNLQRPGDEGDIVTTDDFLSLSADDRTMYIRARREIEKYSDQVIQGKLRQGVPLGKSIVYGTHGISCTRQFTLQESEDRNATYFNMLKHSQVRGLPLDQTAHNIYTADKERWMHAGKDFLTVFAERGKTADTLQILADAGALAHIWPAFATLETHPDLSGTTKSTTLSEKALLAERCLDGLILVNSRTGKPEDEKRFNEYVHKEYFSLSPEYQTAVKLALFTKDMNADGLQQIHISQELKVIVDFLNQNSQAYIDVAMAGMNNDQAVQTMTNISDAAEKLRALYVFSHASHLSPEDKKVRPHLWDSLEELHGKAMNHLLGNKSVVYNPHMYSEIGQEIVEELKLDFMAGKYASLAPSWIQRLCKVIETGQPRVDMFYFRGAQHLGVASKDFKGLLSVIAGACLDQEVDILQANVFSPSTHGLALDFFCVNPSAGDTSKIVAAIKSALELRTYPNILPDEILSKAELNWSLKKARDDALFTLECSAQKNKPGILYAITRKLSQDMQANIYALTAHVNPITNVASNYIHFASPTIESVDEMGPRIEQMLARK